MSISLLATKLRIPAQTRHTIRRDRLIDAVEKRIPDYKLIHISAPAGYGKTTLLAQWAHSSHYKVVWLTLNEDDNDPDRFFRYLLSAWEVIHPDIRETELGLLLGGMSPDSEAVLSASINVANDITENTVFVLDDYHLIEDTTIHRALTFLLDHLPPRLHIVLASRDEPPLPIARYRARHELLEYRAGDLRFLPEESTKYLNEMMGLDLTYDEVVNLQTRLEGWIAGLQLVALGRKQRLGATDKMVVSGRHRFIADYLSEDVLAPLPEDMRQFLLQTSILDRMSGPLCDSITEKENGQDMLEKLERANLFLTPLDDRREWFRYHQLFADFLREMLEQNHPEMVPGLHNRAAQWQLAHNMPEPAYRHAIEGNHAEIVVQIFDRYVDAKLNSGEIRVVKHWIDSLPAEWYDAYPVLGLARVGYLAFTGAFEACTRCIDDVEQRLVNSDSDQVGWQLARVIAVRCLMACMQNDLDRAESYAGRALQALPEEDNHWRPGIYVALGDTHRRNGNWGKAKESYLEALSVADSPQMRFMSAQVFGALADLALRQGRLRDADGYWRRALAVIQEGESWGRMPLPVIGWVYIRMGELLYERNQLAEARDHLMRGLEHAELGGDARSLIAGCLIAGRLKLTEGDTEAAAAYLERARDYVESAQFSHWISRFERLQLEIWLAQDMLRAAVQWSDKMLREATIEQRPESEEAQLAMARVLIVKGDSSSVERALALLKRLRHTADVEGRMGIILEAEAIQALAYQRRGETLNALTSLERALRLAKPESYVRLFADLGLSMARLLQEASSRNVMPDYVEKLLAAFGDDPAFADGDEASLPEPLTQREQEILELVAAGLTNREIAEQLVISPETVKKHTGNIYGKLNVSNRTEATARARELNLLD